VTLRSFAGTFLKIADKSRINPRKSASIPDAARGGGMRPSRKNPPISVAVASSMTA